MYICVVYVHLLYKPSRIPGKLFLLPRLSVVCAVKVPRVASRTTTDPESQPVEPALVDQIQDIYMCTLYLHDT